MDQKSWNQEAFYGMVCPVFQEPYLFHATLEENIKLGRDISEKEYHAILDQLNLGYLLKRYAQREISAKIVDQLSGGEQQRIALARAMAGKPQVYLP